MFYSQLSKKKVSLGSYKQSDYLPDLIEVQVDSYNSLFETGDNKSVAGKSYSLDNIFSNTFPIYSINKKIVLEYKDCFLDSPKLTEVEAKRRGLTYACDLKVVMRLVNLESEESIEQSVYVAEIPKMTPRGTFIVNGSERVIVSQIHRTPGVSFNETDDKQALTAKIIPDKGVWLEFEVDRVKDVVLVNIDRKKSIPVTVFLRALGYNDKSSIIKEFYDIETVSTSESYIKMLIEDNESSVISAVDIYESDDEVLILGAGQEIFAQDLDRIVSFDIENIKIIKPSSLSESKSIFTTLDGDSCKTEQDAVSLIYSIIRPGEIVNLNNAVKDFRDTFLNPKRYSLGVVGRYKLDQRLYSMNNYTDDLNLRVKDVVSVIKYLLAVNCGKSDVDDIDHLGSRRVRSVGELLSASLKTGFARMERITREKLHFDDKSGRPAVSGEDSISFRTSPYAFSPSRVMNVKPINAVIKEFFGSSQLSQFMDQINSLSELTHKRRITALGPGGLSKERAGFAVRDVHYTHCHKICPVETSEGHNIGLVLSPAIYAKINPYGFLSAPYRKVLDGVITEDIVYLTAIEEDKYYIIYFNLGYYQAGRITDNVVLAKKAGEFLMVPSSDVSYVDVFPNQIVSISTSLIPFLEHNDANRALMGSNMQRQAVPLLFNDNPKVCTGIEAGVAKYSYSCLFTKRAGEVIKVCADEVHVKVDDYDSSVSDDNPVDIYNLTKYSKTNQNTCFNQRHVVKLGQKLEKDSLIADGSSCKGGELALGNNLQVAVMCWKGYNFEDAIILSERVVSEDLLTSISIEEFTLEVKDTKLGPEVITRDIPHIQPSCLLKLDSNGVVKVGSYVVSGDILVGKTTPKVVVESSPEYKLLQSIFGEKAKEVKDTSLRVPSSISGVVTKVECFYRDKHNNLPPGINQIYKIYISDKRKVRVGDKLSGRHGNKGVVSKILAVEDMPYCAETGNPVDIILNPLGVPSRMNLGQILEIHLGLAAVAKDIRYEVPVFDSNNISKVVNELKDAGFSDSGKIFLHDGQTGERFKFPVTVGWIHILKLYHMVLDKVHARSTGPYSLVTQQPLGGKAQFGGQRLGEMEVWALQAHGAAHSLQEFLTVKSDDMEGRTRIYEDIVRGNVTSSPGVPESFNVLLQELRGLGMDLNIYNKSGKLISLTERDAELNDKL